MTFESYTILQRIEQALAAKTPLIACMLVNAAESSSSASKEALNHFRQDIGALQSENKLSLHQPRGDSSQIGSTLTRQLLDVLQEGVLAYEAGQLELALCIGNELLSYGVASPGIQHFRATLLEKLGRPMDAFRASFDELQKDPQSAAKSILERSTQAILLHLIELHHQGKTQESIQIMEAFYPVIQNFSEVNFVYGALLVHVKKFPEAILCFEKEIQINPTHPSAALHLQDVLKQK